jgi:hypothetical protein
MNMPAFRGNTTIATRTAPGISPSIARAGLAGMKHSLSRRISSQLIATDN